MVLRTSRQVVAGAVGVVAWTLLEREILLLEMVSCSFLRARLKETTNGVLRMNHFAFSKAPPQG